MGYAALGVCTSPPVGGTFLPDSPDSDPDPGADQGFSWCPDGLTERVIDRRYGDLLRDPAPADDLPDGASAGHLLTLPPRRPVAVSAGQGGEVA